MDCHWLNGNKQVTVKFSKKDSIHIKSIKNDLKGLTSMILDLARTKFLLIKVHAVTIEYCGHGVKTSQRGQNTQLVCFKWHRQNKKKRKQ